MLDDAQALYHDKSFWSTLIKVTPMLIPSNIKFLIAATHSLAGGVESPAEFQYLWKLGRTDFLLCDDEANQFLDLPTGFAKDPSPSETDLITYYLSDSVVQQMARYFGSQHSGPISQVLKNALIKCLIDEPIIAPINDMLDVDDKDSRCYTSLMKAGILALGNDGYTLQFSSPLALKYYSKWFFPKRSCTKPSSLHSLIVNAIGNMSASLLQQSTPTCAICPELSKVFPPPTCASTEHIHGEVDFYLNGTFQWGLELLVNDDGITEHIDQFGSNGKYSLLAVNDYAVIDFHGNKTGNVTNIVPNPKRITAFFKLGDFSTCTCIFGLDKEPISIKLRN
ncbi:10715_t:CDS:2 [Paraglomus brasilianum]|uniref:10715_t:CDS:1 n=1 Tax=Paraglomus brasilianum TaxID=144538 RepID=A0A9N8VMB2_9GLOM|nr:10715_t:CDS:2 [Paraglomus brasilianum]